MHHHVLRIGKRVAIGIAGGVVILVGIVMLPLPGPGTVVIVLGLAILSLEFERPRIWMEHLKARGVALKKRVEERRLKRRGHN